MVNGEWIRLMQSINASSDIASQFSGYESVSIVHLVRISFPIARVITISPHGLGLQMMGAYLYCRL